MVSRAFCEHTLARKRLASSVALSLGLGLRLTATVKVSVRIRVLISVKARVTEQLRRHHAPCHTVRRPPPRGSERANACHRRESGRGHRPHGSERANACQLRLGYRVKVQHDPTRQGIS
jgi:hypothetical protein